MPIRVLPPEIACRIAAGEVITRPADVVKELIENAVDAIVEARRLGHAAGSIEVEIAGGGLRTLRVADDGCGIPPDEVPLAFARHATSKVRSLDDLLEVRTLGFRGEALASIAAVAEVTLSTATHRHPAGVVVTVREGAVVDRRRKGRTPGTSVTVRRLFHNVPARLKFLRAPHVESALIGHTVRRYALAYPDIRMTLSVEGQPLFRSRGGPSIREALEDVYGAEVAARLRPLGPISVARVRLAGWIGPPEISRSGKTHVTWLVNGRSAVPRGLVETLEAAYRPFFPRGRHPIAVVVVELPVGAVDPNIHPQKAEVKLQFERELAEALHIAVREALGTRPFAVLSPLRAPTVVEPDRLGSPQEDSWYRRAEGMAVGVREGGPLSRLKLIGQAQESLIVAEGWGGLLLVDQHRAHERILYEILAQREDAAGQEEGLVEPLVLEVPPEQAPRLLARLPELRALGFDCELFGQHAFLVRAAPRLSLPSLSTSIHDLLDDVVAESENWRQRLLVRLACRSAVRRNHPLTAEAMTELLDRLSRCSTPLVCPHGSPVALQLDPAALRKQFDW